MNTLASYARALGGDVAASGEILCPGPGHSPRDRSLSIKIDPAAPGGMLLHSFAGDSWQVCRDHVRDLLGLGRWQASPRPITRIPAKRDDDARIDRALSLWGEAVSIEGTLGERYLAHRGFELASLPDLGHVLRFHPRCPWGEDRLPCMLTLMADPVTGELTGIQRTGLSDDGCKIERRMLGKAGAAFVSPFESVTQGLGIAEGLETSLAILMSGWSPIWGVLSAGGAKAFPVLAGIKTITAFADADAAGHAAARDCAGRWAEAGREARILPAPGARFSLERGCG